jgi:peptide/nickel transport system substrate-binding protein
MAMQSPLTVDQLMSDIREGRLSRRAVLAYAATLGLSVPTITTLLAATMPESALAQDPSTMTVGYDLDIQFLDPQLAQSGQDLLPSSLIYGRLTSYDSTMLDPLPDIAESWTQPDDVTYIFTIRPGVMFHSGRELTAEDIVFSYQRAIDIGDRGRGALELQEVDTFEATGPMEFTVTLQQPSAVFLAATAHWSLSIHDQESIDTVDTQPVGTGPYTFVEWIPDDQVSYQKNPDYWNQEALANWPDRVVSNPIAEALTRIANLQQGEIDLAANIPAQFVSQLEGDPNVQLLTQPFTASYWTINFNVTQPPFDDVLVRRAVGLAIDKEAIHQNAFFGTGEIGCSLIPSTHWAHDPEAIVCQPRNVEAARALMEEAGHADGLQATFKFGGNSADIEPPMAEIVRENLAEIGIDLELQRMEPSLWLQEVWLDKNYEMTAAWYTREPDPDGLMQSVLREGGGNNVMGYVNPRVEELFDQGKATLDQDERRPIYTEIMQIMLEDMPLVKLQTMEIVWGASQRVQGMEISPKGYPTYLAYTFVPEPDAG